MDLPYPTKQRHPTRQLNELDKLYRSILLSNRDLPKNDDLPRILKCKVNKYIREDKPYKLRKLLQEQAISFEMQVGTKGSSWNILHLCSKYNSSNCLHYLLRSYYQMLAAEYETLVNLKTVEGYSPLVVAIINRSHKALEVLLGYGGVDIHVIDNHKMTPYEIALNYKNDTAIRILMSYESTSKKKQYLNRKALMEPVLLQSDGFCCQQLWECLISCITFGTYHEDNPTTEGKTRPSIMKSFKEDEQIDFVPIGSTQNLPGYEIEWKRANNLVEREIRLFDSYNPFSIRENNFVIKNQIILFQSLSQQPWLLRKTIKQDRPKDNNYTIYLHPHKTLKKIIIDDNIPFIKDRNEPMFFSSEEQLWPMLLQKGLAKLHEGYISTNSINPRILLQELTGFHTVEVDVSQIPSHKVYDFLQKLVAKSYIYFLRGKEDSSLCEKKGSIDCFNVLNFYEKENKQLVLVNCPFVSEEWKEREKSQVLALKLIKSHYNSPNQMCVWIQAQKFQQYFSKIVVSLAFSHYQKNQLKIKAKKHIFCKFKIQNKRQQPIVFQLSNSDENATIPLRDIQIMKSDGSEHVPLQEGDEFVPQLAYFCCSPGQYMFYLQIEDKYLSDSSAYNNLLILCWSLDGIPLEFVEEQFGILEWFSTLKNRFRMVEMKLMVESIGKLSLVLVHEKYSKKVWLKHEIDESEILEGQLVQEGKVQLIADKKHVHYCVLRDKLNKDQLNLEYE